MIKRGEMSAIKFYGISDLASSHYVEKADVFLSQLDLERSEAGINEVIACTNIIQYIEAGVKNRWDPDLKTKLSALTGRSLGRMKGKPIGSLYLELNQEYHEDFWRVFASYKLYQQYDDSDMQAFFDSSKPEISFLLRVKSLVSRYDKPLKEYLLSDPENAVLLLERYEAEQRLPSSELYLPMSLTLNDKEDLIVRYLESESPNLNYLDLIRDTSNRDDFRISDRTRLLAKRRCEKDTSAFFDKNGGLTTAISVRFIVGQKEEFIVTGDGTTMALSYSADWISQNLDYATLMNNFIYLFGYVDDQMRVTLVSKASEMGTLESLMGVTSRHSYRDGVVFRRKNTVADLQLYSYIEILKSHAVSLEDLIAWFFGEYLQHEFGIDGFGINLPSPASSYLEKCRVIAPEIEAVLKRYNLLVEDGTIDNELLAMSSIPLSFSSCKSFCENKYVYPNSEDFSRVCHLLFSDQCMLHYLPNEEKSFKSFYDLLKERNVSIVDYPEYLRPSLEWLARQGLIKIGTAGRIDVPDMNRLYVFWDLYHNETISFHNFPKVGQEIVKELIAASVLSTQSSLFSVSEQKYFNYCLNRSEFGNSLDLRNIYAHGSQPSGAESSDLHKYNYHVFLKILVLLVIKINDDICTRDRLNASTN